ncbi:tyrosine-type recombinase/integrase [Burkholderia sp. R-69608]|uniref:tyrosine-type recombinase/integrase n=1 Tax=Paraburkholderia nemoris TaxID=2793076 RepID=UPI001913A9DB|nr:site-specific integrase [Paraburkholderia nemoris]MBK5148023.1 tyrosine-type recombinase/integrase [Burkholderia sp. R-69608]
MASVENKLTVIELKALTTADIGHTIKDGGGLWGTVRKGAAADTVGVTFYYRYRMGQRSRDFTCGTWPALSLKDLRAARVEARKLVASGVDPIDQAKADKDQRDAVAEQAKADAEAASNRLLVRGLFDRWVAADLVKRKDGGAETIRGFKKDVLPAIGNRYADEIRRADIMAVLDSVVARGKMRLANRLLAELRQMWGYGLVRELCAIDCTAGIEKKHVGGKDIERERTLSDAELKALPTALKSADLLDSSAHALYVVFGTLVRIGELIQARKADIDLEARIWRIPKDNSKNTDAHVIYLSDFALWHMQKLMEQSKSDIWLMPGRSTDETEIHVGLKSITKQVSDRQIKFYDRPAHSKRTKQENALVLADEKWTPHDLRRTGATLMQSLGVLPVVVDKCLNHRDENRIRRTYQRYDYAKEKQKAWELLGVHLQSVFSTNVLIGDFKKAG